MVCLEKENREREVAFESEGANPSSGKMTPHKHQLRKL